MNSQPLNVRVVKMGGSLLDFQPTPVYLSRWISRQPPMTTIWIVGGGQLVDAIRRLDDVHQFAPATTHWVCVDLMDVASRLFSAWFPDWPLIEDPGSIHGAGSAANVILAPARWMRELSDPLPVSWDVTSDSIAAKLANTLGAIEIVLLKSTSPPPSSRSRSLQAGVSVDRHFFDAAKKMPVRFVNLRDPNFPEVRWVDH